MHSPTRRLLHVHIPKCAGTAIEASLREYGVDDLGAVEHQKHWSAAAWRGALGREVFDAAFKFAVVRHPGDLLVSSFHYHRDVNPPPSPHWIPPHLRFDQWVREHVVPLPRGMCRELDGLAWWVTERVGDGALDVKWLVDAVIRYDSLAEGWRGVIAPRAGLDPERCPLLHRNGSPHGDWRGYFQEGGLRAAVEERYAEDFALFGWEW